MINSNEERKFEEYTIDKRQNGDFRIYNDDGSYCFGNYLNGEKQDLWVEIKKNGDVEEKKYIDDVMVGKLKIT